MTRVEIEHADIRHAELVAANMREDDRREIEASHGGDHFRICMESIRSSRRAYALLLDGEVAAIFGVAPAGDAGAIWALTTKAVERHPVTFYRMSKLALEVFRAEFYLLFNAVDARYTRAVQWVQRLGFGVTPPQPFGSAGLPFHFISYGGMRHV